MGAVWREDPPRGIIMLGGASRCMLTFDEGVELAVGDVAGLQVRLQRQQQGEEELVLFIQSPGSVAVHLQGATHTSF